MAAVWLIIGLGVATFSAVGALLLGSSMLMAVVIYSGAGLLTMCLGLLAVALDLATEGEFVEEDDTAGMIPGE